MNNSSNPCKFFVTLRSPYLCMMSIIFLVLGVSIARMINIPSDYMLYSWVALPCFVSLMVSLGSYNLCKWQNSKIIKYLSEMSFCIFLAQIIYIWPIVKKALGYVGNESNILKIVLSFLVVFCFANVLHYFVEIPSSKYLKQRFLTNN